MKIRRKTPRNRSFSTDSSVQIDTLVIGGGIVGLAVLERLSRHANQSVVLVEQWNSLGCETTARNSQVVHAGLYYPKHSLKTKFCIEGKELLYQLCRDNGIACQRVGKWIVATQSSEEAHLHQLKKKADELNVETHLLSTAEMAMEPLVSAKAVLASPTTGIVDLHGVLAWLYMRATEHNVAQVDVVLQTAVIDIQPCAEGHLVTLSDATTQKYSVITRTIVNAAGLYAHSIANMIHGHSKFRMYPCIGRYFTHHGPKLASRLIYPAPEPHLAGLGIHLTLDLDGRAKFGPDTRYLDSLPMEDGKISASVYAPPPNQPQLKHSFYTAIKRYIPSIQESHLEFDYAGIRPKLAGPGRASDFVVEHELPGVVNLLGIESPGVTSALALARHVEQLLFCSASNIL